MKKYGFDLNGLVNNESTADYNIKVIFKIWNNSRYYVTRDGKTIGWISIDLSETNGTTSTHKFYLDQMVKAIKSNQEEVTRMRVKIGEQHTKCTRCGKEMVIDLIDDTDDILRIETLETDTPICNHCIDEILA